MDKEKDECLELVEKLNTVNAVVFRGRAGGLLRLLFAVPKIKTDFAVLLLQYARLTMGRMLITYQILHRTTKSTPEMYAQ